MTLPPVAWSLFGLSKPPSKTDWIDIVNRSVNHGIDPKSGPVPNAVTPWHIWPKAGWCHDYAITKRYELMLHGYAPSELLLCECLNGSEHHMVLLVNGLALDNLTDQLLPMRYEIVRKQSHDNPDIWEAA